MTRDCFLEHNWHDAALLSIEINRDNPGNQDIIRLQIRWPDVKQSNILEFYDCYALNAKMNFGIIAEESILTAELLTESPELNSIRTCWQKMGANLHHLNCYQITTNSSNSLIAIFALGYRIL